MRNRESTNGRATRRIDSNYCCAKLIFPPKLLIEQARQFMNLVVINCYAKNAIVLQITVCL